MTTNDSHLATNHRGEIEYAVDDKTNTFKEREMEDVGTIEVEVYSSRSRLKVHDPRPAAARAPYTVFLPSAACVDAILGGDSIKVALSWQDSPNLSQEGPIFEGWLEVRYADAKSIRAKLKAVRLDLPVPVIETLVQVPKAFVMDVKFASFTSCNPRSEAPRREYWDLCQVDPDVLEGKSKVKRVHRETPIIDDGDSYPDSGWRVMGENCIGLDTVTLGEVLNRDDSWLHLIDRPIGASFDRDTETGLYIKHVEHFET